MKKNVRSCDEPNIITEDDVNNMKQKDDERPLDMNTSIEVMYYCDKCDFEYEEEDAMESHKELYQEQIAAHCIRCNLKFPNNIAFNKHKKTMHTAALVF